MRALDAMAAERVMGWRECANRDEALHQPEGVFLVGSLGPGVILHNGSCWSPSTNIADAWGLVEAIPTRIFTIARLRAAGCTEGEIEGAMEPSGR